MGGVSRRVLPAVAAAMAVALAVAGCTSTSELSEVPDDPSRVTAPGPLPTAPPAPEPGQGLSGEAARLVADLEALQDHDDLCEVFFDGAIQRLGISDAEASGLVTSPAGVAQLVAAVDATFTHLVAISPEDARSALVTLADLWTQLALVGTAPDASARADELLERPEVTGAVEQLAGWAVANCSPPPTPDQPLSLP